LIAISRQFERLKADTLTEDFGALSRARPRMRWRDRWMVAAAPGEASDAMAPAQMGKQEALKRFATDITEKARKGQIDPVSGRDEEIRQSSTSSCAAGRTTQSYRRGGRWQTAVVEDSRCASQRATCRRAAERVAHDARHRLLQAGASMKGEFEQRLRR